jgi:amino acid permease
VSSVSASGGRSTGRTATAVILAIIAVLFIIAGILYIAMSAGSLPSFLAVGSSLKGSTGHHTTRAIGSFVLAVILLVGSWFALRSQPKSSAPAESRENSPAGQH